MRILGTVAEYNPFHLGHMKHIEYIKNQLKADRLIVVMSGNFTQRGEPAVLNKFTRAKEAIVAGADMVIELPTVFSTANAEIFCKGAIKVLNSLNIVEGICFGIESGEKQQYIDLAKAFNNETKEFKKILKEKLEQGVSLAKAKFETLKALGNNEFNQDIISSPNNILGLEYTRAILASNSNIDIFPLIRTGNHNDVRLKKGITSATSIRLAIKTDRLKKVKGNLPKFVYRDLKPFPYAFDKMIMSKLFSTSTEDLKKICDCTEGLENRIKALSKDNYSTEMLVEKTCTKRYTATRIRRILTANFLGITKDFITECMANPLYIKVLAVNSECKDLISLISEKASVPVITRKSDIDKLKKTALKCFEKDILANDLYNLATEEKENENQMAII